jgi:hypothetical protein
MPGGLSITEESRAPAASLVLVESYASLQRRENGGGNHVVHARPKRRFVVVIDSCPNKESR